MGKTLGIRTLHASKSHQQEGGGFAVVPPWVVVMYNTIFFRNCLIHPTQKKNELDRFCIDCLRSFCSHCLSAHSIHKHVKIRRYVYSDVINRQDLCKLFNCSGIQSYQTNKAKVLFLKQRTHQQHQQQQQQNNPRDYSCIICDKRLQDNSLYCSIACKVLDMYKHEHMDGRNKFHNHTKFLGCFKEEKKAYIRLPSTKKQRLKPTRKGVPLRAPMF